MARRKIVKPTPVEQKKITKQLQRKYPQMYEPMLTRAEKKVISRAAKSERKELERMVGKRLKKIYRSK
jgi:Leu/Phe-tRNA-protein transferase